MGNPLIARLMEVLGVSKDSGADILVNTGNAMVVASLVPGIAGQIMQLPASALAAQGVNVPALPVADNVMGNVNPVALSNLSPGPNTPAVMGPPALGVAQGPGQSFARGK